MAAQMARKPLASRQEHASSACKPKDMATLLWGASPRHAVTLLLWETRTIAMTSLKFLVSWSSCVPDTISFRDVGYLPEAVRSSPEPCLSYIDGGATPCFRPWPAVGLGRNPYTTFTVGFVDSPRS